MGCFASRRQVLDNERERSLCDEILSHLPKVPHKPRKTESDMPFVNLGECRYPVANPVGDAFAHLSIQNVDTNDTMFKGWMIASSPALNSLEHARYDVWQRQTCALNEYKKEHG